MNVTKSKRVKSFSYERTQNIQKRAEITMSQETPQQKYIFPCILFFFLNGKNGIVWIFCLPHNPKQTNTPTLSLSVLLNQKKTISISSNMLSDVYFSLLKTMLQQCICKTLISYSICKFQFDTTFR